MVLTSPPRRASTWGPPGAPFGLQRGVPWNPLVRPQHTAVRPGLIPHNASLSVEPLRRNFLLILVSRNCTFLKTKACLLLYVMGINLFAPPNMKFREVFMLHWKQIFDFYIGPLILFYIFFLYFLLVFESLKTTLNLVGTGQNETNGQSA